MSIGSWMVAGALVGIVSLLLARSREGLLRDVGLGIAGAMLAGVVFHLVTVPDDTATGVFALVVAAAGGCAALIVYYTFFPRVRST